MRRSLLSAQIGFVLTGVITTLLGPLLPALSARWSLTDASAGYLFTAQFLGSLAGVALTGALFGRLGFRRSLAGAYVLMAAGTLGLGSTSVLPGSASVFVYGIGLGIVIPGTNLMVAELNGSRRASALNFLNFYWCAGAVLSPPVVARFLEFPGFESLVLFLAAALLTAGLCIGLTLPSTPPRTTAATAVKSTGWRHPYVLLCGFLIFFYVGTENSIAGWAPTLSIRSGSGPEVWAVAQSFFWGFILLGRAAAPLLFSLVVLLANLFMLLLLWRTAPFATRPGLRVSSLPGVEAS